VNLAEYWNEPELAKRKTKEEWKELVYKRIEQDQEDKRMLDMAEMVSLQRHVKKRNGAGWAPREHSSKVRLDNSELSCVNGTWTRRPKRQGAS